MTHLLFLGAGASKTFGFPTTKQIRDQLKAVGPLNFQGNDAERNAMHNILQLILNISSDIEVALRVIDQFNPEIYDTKYIWKFLKQYHFVGKVQRGSVAGLTNDLNLPIEQLINHNAEIKKRLEEFVLRNYSWGSDPNLYEVTEEERESRLTIILEKLVEKLFHKNYGKALEIFTTNYDTVIENFGRLTSKYEVITGKEYMDGELVWVNDFSESEHSQKQINLYKLHGSIRWKRRISDGRILVSPEEGPPSDPSLENVLIQPIESIKDEIRDPPFSELYTTLVGKLNKVDVLVVIGCSYRDPEINKNFSSFAQRPQTKIVDISGRKYQGFKKFVKDHNVEYGTTHQIVEVEENETVATTEGKFLAMASYYDEENINSLLTRI